MKSSIFNISFRCHYPSGEYTTHRQDLKIADIPKWIEAYKFTHPECVSISFKLWFADMET